jgi:hypothetical protein
VSLLTRRLTRDPEMRVVSNGKNVTHVFHDLPCSRRSRS